MHSIFLFIFYFPPTPPAPVPPNPSHPPNAYHLNTKTSRYILSARNPKQDGKNLRSQYVMFIDKYVCVCV